MTHKNHPATHQNEELARRLLVECEIEYPTYAKMKSNQMIDIEKAILKGIKIGLAHTDSQK